MPLVVRPNGNLHEQRPTKFYRQRWFWLLSGALFLIVLGVGLLVVLKPKPASQPDVPTPIVLPPEGQNPNRVRIIATGDVIPHDAMNAAAKNGNNYNYLQFMDNMLPLFAAADVRFCNQAVLGAGEKFGIKGYPVFNSPTQVARDMQKVGCNVVNTGSNHTNDLGQAEINASVAAWDDLPNMLAVAGANRSEAEKQQVRYFEKKGVKFAFLSYTTYTNTPGKTSYGLTIFNESLAKKQLQEARKSADIVMVSMRWGTEYSPKINAQQTTQANFLAKHGADIVLGHGPHVLEPVKKLKRLGGRDTYVWFSLGNFLNAQLEVEGRVNGLAVMDIDTITKKITTIGYLPTYMHYDWTTAQAAREDLMARKNFEMYLLEEAAEPLKKSQLNTTVETQQRYVQKVLNTYTKVPILTSQQYLGS